MIILYFTAEWENHRFWWKIFHCSKPWWRVYPIKGVLLLIAISLSFYYFKECVSNSVSIVFYTLSLTPYDKLSGIDSLKIRKYLSFLPDIIFAECFHFTCTKCSKTTFATSLISIFVLTNRISSIEFYFCNHTIFCRSK